MRLRVIDLRQGEETAEDFKQDVLRGLSADPKRIPPKYFYDSRGSELFEKICELPEYYPTRTEMAILRDHSASIARRIGPGATLIELGSGNSAKVRLLLNHLQSPAAYVPIDIAQAILLESAERLSREYPGLAIVPIRADYTGLLNRLHGAIGDRSSKVIFFPGSTLGNLEREEASEFLSGCARFLGPGGRMILGVDRVKDIRILEAAYNDTQGVTANFNLNLLLRMNRELGADFHPEHFRHHAFFNEREQAIEMHLISRREQTVHIAGQPILLGRNERIHTECSRKYTSESLDALITSAGFRRLDEWMDPDQWFCVAVLEVSEK